MSEDPIEVAVQRLLDFIQSEPDEVQIAFCSRLLQGFLAKPTATSVKKAIDTARIPSSGLVTKKSGGTSNKKKEQDLPPLVSQLESLKDSSDPFEAWNTFGGTPETVLAVFSQEPEGVLDMLLSDHRLPVISKIKPKTRKAKAQAIVDRLVAYFARH